MNKEVFDKAVVDVDDNVPYTMELTYYLLSDSVREEYCDLKVYGAEIEKVCKYPDGSSEGERKVIKNLFFRKGEAEDFLKKISRQTVTPMGLTDAVNAHICERIKVFSS